MSPARAQLESFVEALRRKQLLAIVVTALVEMALVAAFVFALLRLGLPNVVLSRSRRVVLVLGMILVFVAALLLEQARQARSHLFLAKRIDDANQLGDHLVSAISFADPVRTPYEQACIDTLILRLQQQAVHIPDVRLERVWLLVPALLVAGITGAIEYRRRVRPQDDGRVAIALPAALGEQLKGLGTAGNGNLDKLDPTLAKTAAATRDMLDKMLQHAASKEDMLRDLSKANQELARYEADNPSLADAATQLGRPSSERVGDVQTAVQADKPAALTAALDKLAKALSGTEPPPLSAQERQEIAALFEKLGQTTHDETLQAELKDAAKSMREGTAGEAGKALAKAGDGLRQELTREEATKQVVNATRTALAQWGRQVTIAASKAARSNGPQLAVADGGVAGGAAEGGKNQPGSTDDPVSDVSGGTGGGAGDNPGAGSATDPNYKTGSPEQPQTGQDVRITSQWVNAPVRQIVAAGSSADKGAQEAARAMLAVEQRQVEREVRREEIPAEYAQSIRRYFSNIQQSWEREWK